MIALELNDTGLRAAIRRSELLPIDGGRMQSPGFAWAGPAGLITGCAARAHAKIAPTEIHPRYWHELGTTPMARRFAGARHTADIALVQWKAAMAALPKGEPVAIVLPPVFDANKLGLLLGMCEAAGRMPHGLYDAGAAALDAESPLPHRLWVDFTMHAAVLALYASNTRVTALSTRLLGDAGLYSLHNHWLRSVAREFVRQTRFDPLHSAATEQSLYDALPDYLEHGLSGELRLEHGGRLFTATIPENAVLDAVAEPYQNLLAIAQTLLSESGVNPATCELVLSPRARSCPGLGALLETIGAVNATSMHDPVWGALEWAAQAAGGQGGRFKLLRERTLTASTFRGADFSPATPPLGAVSDVPDAALSASITIPSLPPRAPAAIMLDGQEAFVINDGPWSLVHVERGRIWRRGVVPGALLVMRAEQGQAFLRVASEIVCTLNGQPAPSGQEYLIAAGDRIALADEQRLLLFARWGGAS